MPEIVTKNVAKGVTRANIARFFHKDYVEMFRCGDARNFVNRRIGSKLHQVCQSNSQHFICYF